MRNLSTLRLSSSLGVFVFVCRFLDHHYLSIDKVNGTFESDTIDSEFKEVHSDLDAAFAFQGHLYMMKVHSSRNDHIR